MPCLTAGFLRSEQGRAHACCGSNSPTPVAQFRQTSMLFDPLPQRSPKAWASDWRLRGISSRSMVGQLAIRASQAKARPFTSLSPRWVKQQTILSGRQRWKMTAQMAIGSRAMTRWKDSLLDCDSGGDASTEGNGDDDLHQSYFLPVLIFLSDKFLHKHTSTQLQI